MKKRLLLALILIAAGIVAPVLAVSSRGLPWGFRDRVAVIIDHVGTVEIQARAGETTSASNGQGLLAGQEVRVGGLSEVRVRCPRGTEITFHDGTQATFLPDGVLAVSRGWARVSVRGGVFRVRAGGLAADIELGPGEHLLSADGRELVMVAVLSGSARASADGGSWLDGEAGHVLTIKRGQSPSWAEPAKEAKCPSACNRVGGANAQIVGKSPPGSQVFVNGRLTYPTGDGRFRSDIPLASSEDEVTVFVRDVAGQICVAEPRCPPLR